MDPIVKADIIADVNENLLLGLAEDSTALDKAIIKTLMDMSNKGLLVGSDASQTLSDGDLTLDYPAGYRSAISITLTDGSGAEKSPLIKLPGGHQEYRELRHNDDATGTPEYYSEFNEEIYPWRPPGQAYTTLIEYRKNHAKTADTIEFTTEFENLMFAGATFWKAAALTRSASVKLWGPIYSDLLRTAMLNRKTQPSIVRG